MPATDGLRKHLSPPPPCTQNTNLLLHPRHHSQMQAHFTNCLGRQSLVLLRLSEQSSSRTAAGPAPCNPSGSSLTRRTTLPKPRKSFRALQQLTPRTGLGAHRRGLSPRVTGSEALLRSKGHDAQDVTQKDACSQQICGFPFVRLVTLDRVAGYLCHLLPSTSRTMAVRWGLEMKMAPSTARRDNKKYISLSTQELPFSSVVYQTFFPPIGAPRVQSAGRGIVEMYMQITSQPSAFMSVLEQCVTSS